MKITRQSTGESANQNPCVETSGWRIEYSSHAITFRAGDGSLVIIEGDLYYSVKKDGQTSVFSAAADLRELLRSLFDSYGKEGFNQFVEGEYNAAVIDGENDVVEVFGDAYCRLNLFYSIDKNIPVISTDFRDVILRAGSARCDPEVLSCIVLLGYPPSRHTPYSGIRRLGVGERLLLKHGEMVLKSAVAVPVDSVDMDDSCLDDYAEILENAVLSRASQSENWVEISGGWDSTIVLGVLRKYFDAANVRAVVNAFEFSDGRRYNPYEVDKSLKIGAHYGISVDIAATDFGDTAFPEKWARANHHRRSDFVYFWIPAFDAMADVISESGKPDAGVFVGSFADSIHNFGFSQYVALPFLSYDFRAYGDKMVSYLYSPEFLRKVIDNTYEEDFVYKLFKWHNSNVTFVNTSDLSRNQRLFEYLVSFVLSTSRLPFASIGNDSVFRPHSEVQLKDWLYNNYFQEVVEQITPENMYFWLMWLYEHFHLRGAERGAVNSSVRGVERRPCWPFCDLKMMRFMERMPDNWGRGLEWRPAKYPLKHYGSENLRIPYEIIESGVHSYIDETEAGHQIDWRSEAMNNSTLTPITWKTVRNEDTLKEVFDDAWFNTEAMYDMLLKGKSASGTALPLNLLTILSTGFEDTNEI